MSVLREACAAIRTWARGTVFNALTGLRQHTGKLGRQNGGYRTRAWYGETLRTGRSRTLPGAYSLLSGSPEEMVASDCLTFEAQDAVIVVCDATCLER